MASKIASGTLILDACVLINLFASMRCDEILRTIPVSTVVIGEIVRNESNIVYAGPLDNVKSAQTVIDVEPLVQAGLLRIATRVGETEDDLFVFLSAILDDGEAETIALAVARHWAIATDDLKANQYLAQYAAHIETVSTVDLLMHWANESHASDATVREVVQNVRYRARFTLSSKHPYYGWWSTFLP